MPTLFNVIPTLEFLMTHWESMVREPKFEGLSANITSGLENLYKWYRQLDDSSAYFNVSSKFIFFIVPSSLISYTVIC